MSFSLEYPSVAVAEALRAAALLIGALISWFMSSLDLSNGNSARRSTGPSRSSVREIKRRLPVCTYGDLLAAYGGEEDDTASHGDSDDCCDCGSSHESDSAPAATCAVCLNAVDRSDEVRELRNCRHVFHKGCLDRWVDHDENGGTCPLCRAPLLQRPTPPPPMPQSQNSWAVDRLIYLFADDVLLGGGQYSYQVATASSSF